MVNLKVVLTREETALPWDTSELVLSSASLRNRCTLLMESETGFAYQLVVEEMRWRESKAPSALLVRRYDVGSSPMEVSDSLDDFL
jgi:hypothetical protein